MSFVLPAAEYSNGSSEKTNSGELNQKLSFINERKMLNPYSDIQDVTAGTIIEKGDFLYTLIGPRYEDETNYQIRVQKSDGSVSHRIDIHEMKGVKDKNCWVTIDESESVSTISYPGYEAQFPPRWETVAGGAPDKKSVEEWINTYEKLKEAMGAFGIEYP